MFSLAACPAMLGVAPETSRMAGLFTMQTLSHHHTGEKSSEGECGKQSNVISVPQGIFSGVMPPVNANCLSWSRAICGSPLQACGHQPALIQPMN